MGDRLSQWMRDLFEYEDCEECGRGAEDHDEVEGPFGLPFARCRRPPEDSSDLPGELRSARPIDPCGGAARLPAPADRRLELSRRAGRAVAEGTVSGPPEAVAELLGSLCALTDTVHAIGGFLEGLREGAALALPEGWASPPNAEESVCPGCARGLGDDYTDGCADCEELAEEKLALDRAAGIDPSPPAREGVTS